MMAQQVSREAAIVPMVLFLGTWPKSSCSLAAAPMVCARLPGGRWHTDVQTSEREIRGHQNYALQSFGGESLQKGTRRW